MAEPEPTPGSDPRPDLSSDPRSDPRSDSRSDLHADPADPFERTPLHYAAADGEADAVRDLLAAGADPQQPDVAGFTPLHLAAQEQRPDIVRLLIEAGADVHARDRWGNTPLYRAVMGSHGDTATVSALIEFGADPDEAGSAGVSPRRLREAIESRGPAH